MRAPIRGTEIYFDVDGAELAFDGVKLRERATAFLVHGGPGSDHTYFKPRYGLLAKKMQLVYFDQRGHGRSARGNPEHYTLHENVEDMEELRKYLGLGQIISIGHSYGGMVAMAHAARYPNSVSHLILVTTAAHAGLIARAKEIVAERGTPEQIAQCDDLFAGRLDTAEKMQHYGLVMGPLYTRTFDSVTARIPNPHAIPRPEPLNRAYAPGGCMTDFDLRPELGAITAKTLILAGRHDWICAPEFSIEIHKLISGSDLRIFEESSHSLVADQTTEFLDAVSGFIVYRT